VAFLHQSLVDVADETIDQFDRCLAEEYARAGHDLDEFRGSMAQATNETVRLFGELARVVLDPTVGDAQLRHAIYRRIPPERLRKAVEEASGIVRPEDDSALDFLRKRYGHLRQFVPAFLAAFPFRSNVDPDPLLKAVDLLLRLGDRRGPSLPRKTPVEFVPAKWRPFVVDGQGRIDRAYFELCVLSELRAALRAGDVWLESSRRYSDPETYLIPRDRWATLRDLRDVVGASVEALGRVVHLPEPSRGRADQLGGRASDPAGGGEPEGMGWEPHLGRCSRPGSAHVRAGDVPASRAAGPGVRQPDPARLRQSPAPAPYPPHPALIKSHSVRTPPIDAKTDLILGI
jgi:hypothetical protein